MKKKILTFDCYGTLLDTKPLTELIKKIAVTHGLNGERANAIFTAFEDRLMYGEDHYIPFDELIAEDLRYCDSALNTNVFAGYAKQAVQTVRNFHPFLRFWVFYDNYLPITAQF